MKKRGSSRSIIFLTILLIVAGIGYYWYTTTYGPKPFYRFVDTLNENNYYTTNTNDEFVSTLFIDEKQGSIGCIFTYEKKGTVPLYGLKKYIKNKVGENFGFISFYTANTQEKDEALTQGWTEPTVAGYIFSSQEDKTVPIYRITNPTTEKNIYTTEEIERNAAVKSGLTDKGITGYIYPNEFCN